ncbi:carbon-nitrogen hydrolase family protein [Catenulispora yoronensis]|uniref:Carbon-nitrogen hydrolase family protein n=1 Tax=Catenulispora yoronensis TaxID=450799 RepID=A0ABP5F2U0_9ACTN
MTDTLILAVAQPHTVSYAVAANAEVHAAAIRSAQARVVVFPELSLTGYEYDAPAVSADDPRLAPIIEACAETAGLALVGAPVADTSGRSYIAVLAVEGTGARVAYRKIHTHADEQTRFSPGDRPAVVTVDGWRLGLAICRDTGIAQHVTDTAALGMDVYVAGILDYQSAADVPDDRARRIAQDHGVWVAFASFAGSTGAGYDAARGHSAIWAPDGEVRARAGVEPGEVVRAVLSKA